MVYVFTFLRDLYQKAISKLATSAFTKNGRISTVQFHLLVSLPFTCTNYDHSHLFTCAIPTIRELHAKLNCLAHYFYDLWYISNYLLAATGENKTLRYLFHLLVKNRLFKQNKQWFINILFKNICKLIIRIRKWFKGIFSLYNLKLWINITNLLFINKCC